MLVHLYSRDGSDIEPLAKDLQTQISQPLTLLQYSTVQIKKQDD